MVARSVLHASGVMTTLARVLSASLAMVSVVVSTSASADEHREGSHLGVAVTAGVGVGGFANRTMRDTTEPGGEYAGRITVGTRLPVALEASYIGTAQYLDTFGLNNDAVLFSNGAQGAVRINVLPQRALTPFVFGGIAWRHYTLANVRQTNTSNVAANDNVAEIPLGAGLALRAGGLVIDLRGDYRVTFREDLVDAAPSDHATHAPMNRWGMTLSVGVEL